MKIMKIMKKIILILIALTPLLFCKDKIKNEIPSGVKVETDIPYVTGGGLSQRLDLYLPEATPDKPLPVIVMIHGGSWIGGDKSRLSWVSRYVPQGYIGVSINYRFSKEAIFPAQIVDCKSAIRWLRANSTRLHIDPERIGVWGLSAGGHLAALLGTAGNIKEFEQGENLQFSSKVQAVCDLYGPTTFIKEHDPENFEKYAENPNVALLLGGPMREKSEECVKASPIHYVAADCSPFLIMHGDKDQTVPIKQSEIFTEALKKQGISVTFQVLQGGLHGGAAFNSSESIQLVDSFFQKYLKEKS